MYLITRVRRFILMKIKPLFQPYRKDCMPRLREISFRYSVYDLLPGDKGGNIVVSPTSWYRIWQSWSEFREDWESVLIYIYFSIGAYSSLSARTRVFKARLAFKATGNHRYLVIANVGLRRCVASYIFNDFIYSRFIYLFLGRKRWDELFHHVVHGEGRNPV